MHKGVPPDGARVDAACALMYDLVFTANFNSSYIIILLRKMIQEAWKWAATSKNLRKSPIHGEEEARLILNDKFEAGENTTHETQMAGNLEVEAA